MNLDLESTLRECGVTFSRLSKSEKVKILARWIGHFPELVASARHGQFPQVVVRDRAADLQYARMRDEEFFVLPDDASGMPSYHCRAGSMPDLHELVSDSVTKCDELVVVASDFRWSAVFVNHGSPQLVGRHFQVRSDLPAVADGTKGRLI